MGDFNNIYIIRIIGNNTIFLIFTMELQYDFSSIFEPDHSCLYY